MELGRMTHARWVGLFFFVGLFLLFVLAMRVDDEGHIFKGPYHRQFRARMAQVSQIGEGSIVRMAGTGVKIGRVEGLKLVTADEGDRFEIEIVFSLIDWFEVREDSQVRLAMVTLLQGMVLEITPGTPSSPLLEDGAIISTGEARDFMETISKIGSAVEGLGDGGLGRMLLGDSGLEKVDKILETAADDGGLGKWVLGEEAHKNLEPTLADLRKTVENVRKGTEGGGAIARLLHDEKLGEKMDGLLTDLRESMKGVRKFAADIAEGKGVIARLASDEELGEKLDGIVTDIRGVVADLRGGKSVLARLISDEGMGKELGSTVTSLSKFAENLATGEGTIARLISDPDLYIEAKKLVTQAREAVEDAREAAPISAFSSILFGAVQ